MTTQLMIPAAGSGSRLGFSTPKALVNLADDPILVHTLRRFAELNLIDNAIILVPPEQSAQFEESLSRAFPENSIRIVEGGAERQDSVANGLNALDPSTKIVVIHDAARPFVDTAAIQASIEAAVNHGAATLAIPCIDTILQGDAEAMLVDTPDRSHLWACQTPQTFQVDIIRAAHAKAGSENILYTDDATLVRATGAPVKIVNGSTNNFKITTKEDLAYADYLIKECLA